MGTQVKRVRFIPRSEVKVKDTQYIPSELFEEAVYIDLNLQIAVLIIRQSKYTLGGMYFFNYSGNQWGVLPIDFAPFGNKPSKEELNFINSDGVWLQLQKLRFQTIHRAFLDNGKVDKSDTAIMFSNYLLRKSRDENPNGAEI